MAIWAAVILVPLVCGGWVGMLISQRILRSRAESMLADLQLIHVGTSTREEAQDVISKWYGWGVLSTTCSGDECATFLRLKHTLPAGVARIVDHLGGRNSMVGAGFRYKGDTVTGKGFSEQVALPMGDWYARGGAYVPELLVSVDEDLDFTPAEQDEVQAGDPFRVVRTHKGPYDVRINFTPQEAEGEKQKLMAFRFSCLTQFLPCHDESEILPAVGELRR
jgi:hypothetical protein